MALTLLTLRREPDMISPRGADKASAAASVGLTLERYLALATLLMAVFF